MEKEELIKAIGNNKELGEKLIQLWKDGAAAEELAAVLAEAGLPVEVSHVEEVLSEAQEKKAMRIAAEKLDSDQLDKITGGNKNCNNVNQCYFDWACSVAWNNCWRLDNCVGNMYCDTNAGCFTEGSL